jgi:prepilin-type N-terminal cleavage/methylation domain-containing protein
MSNAAKGFTLVELLVATALLALLTLLVAPLVHNFASGATVELAAGEIAVALRQARAYAVRHSANVGVKFRTGDDGRVRWGLYLDGNGNGVRTKEIDSGVDPLAAPVRTLAHFGHTARFGFPAGRAPRDPSDPRRRLDRLDDPIRFNASDIASFTPFGGSTPGSIYVTDGRHRLLAVRVSNRTGRVHVLSYDPRRERWR